MVQCSEVVGNGGCSDCSRMQFQFFCGVFLSSLINISLGEQNTAGIVELIQKQERMTKTHTAASQMPGPGS